MPLSRRYTPEHAPNDVCRYGMDYSFVIPPGIGIQFGALSIWKNTVPPVLATADWPTIDPVQIQGRAIYARLGGGVEGTDYQLRWEAIDTEDNVWYRTALVLCAYTS